MYGPTSVDKRVWFGVLALMVVDIGLMHPPEGKRVLITNRLAKGVPLVKTFKA